MLGTRKRLGECLFQSYEDEDARTEQETVAYDTAPRLRTFINMFL